MFCQEQLPLRHRAFCDNTEVSATKKEKMKGKKKKKQKEKEERKRREKKRTEELSPNVHVGPAFTSDTGVAIEFNKRHCCRSDGNLHILSSTHRVDVSNRLATRRFEHLLPVEPGCPLHGSSGTVQLSARSAVFSVNMPDPIRKRFGYGKLWPLRPFSRQNGPDRIFLVPLPASDSVPFFQRRPGSYCAKPTRIRYGLPGQVLAKLIWS